MVGHYLIVTDEAQLNNGDTSFGHVSIPHGYQLGQFLVGFATPLAYGGLVFGASCLLAVYAARLDLDIVLSDQDEAEQRSPAAPDSEPDL